MEEKRPVGRPSKYKQEYCEMLIQHMEGGLSYDSFSGLIRVNPDTMYQWEKVHPEFSESKKIGQKLSLLFWEKMMRSGASGQMAGFSASSTIFVMKCRFSWKETQVVEHVGGVRITGKSKEEKLAEAKRLLSIIEEDDE